MENNNFENAVNAAVKSLNPKFRAYFQRDFPENLALINAVPGGSRCMLYSTAAASGGLSFFSTNRGASNDSYYFRCSATKSFRGGV